jgi:meiotically up-regulated gene 157 (Mug157) protein
MYDEPPGSLELLAWHGFITADDPVYLATVAYIRDPAYRFSFSGRKVDEIGCEHAPQPWILSLANSLLCGRSEKGRRILSSIPMDDGLACESVDPDTGELVTGAAFATCAGFLSFAMLEAFGDRQ